MDDISRQTATDNDQAFALTIAEVASRYELAGHPRTVRTLQRYCKNGHLDALKKPTLLGDIYLVTLQSVDRHIAQTIEMHGSAPVATGRVSPRLVPATDAPEDGGSSQGTLTPTGRDAARLGVTSMGDDDIERSNAETTAARDEQMRHTANADPEVSRLVALVASENQFLRAQVNIKDAQIKDLTERARETNHLIAGLQRMLSPLLRARRDDSDTHQEDDEDHSAPFGH